MNPIIYQEIQFYPIPDYDRYYISLDGIVLSCGRYKEGNEYRKIMKTYKSHDGYVKIKLKLNNSRIRRTESIHRLLVQVFLPDFSPELQVDHKDCNRLNNDLSNLHMVTQSGNSRNMKFYSGVNLMYDKRRGHYNYRTSWYDDNGARKIKTFSCQYYGFGDALRLAQEKREEMVDLYYNRPIL